MPYPGEPARFFKVILGWLVGDVVSWKSAGGFPRLFRGYLGSMVGSSDVTVHSDYQRCVVKWEQIMWGPKDEGTRTVDEDCERLADVAASHRNLHQSERPAEWSQSVTAPDKMVLFVSSERIKSQPLNIFSRGTVPTGHEARFPNSTRVTLCSSISCQDFSALVRDSLLGALELRSHHCRQLIVVSP